MHRSWSTVTNKQSIVSCARYLLTHRNWKFQKYMSQKVHSDDMPTIEATSADNVLMAVGTLDACQIP